MKWTSCLVAGALLLTLTVASGALHGRWSNRWGARPDFLSAAELLQRTPLTIGDWEATGDNQLDPNVARLLQCFGYINRVYENKKTGDFVAVAVLLGPPGPISVHTPEICYSSRDYRTIQARKRRKLENVNGESDELWDLRMQANDVSQSHLRVMYGWGNKKVWNASESPRFTYGASPYLYKLQLAAPESGDTQNGDLCEEFLLEFLPVLRNAMIEVH